MSRDKRTGFHISKESVDKLFPKTDIDILGYESPINIMLGQMRMEQENGIFNVVQEQGVAVDKDELIKALQYDRGQYDKGYINGYIAGASDVAREIFEEIEKIPTDNLPYVVYLTIHTKIAELKKKYEKEEIKNEINRNSTQN